MLPVPKRVPILAALLASAVASPPPAASEPTLKASAARQIALLKEIQSAKGGVERKIASRLYLAVLTDRKDPRLTSFPELRFVTPEADGRVLTEITVREPGGTAAVREAAARLGGEVESFSERHRSLQARLPLAAVGEVAALASVRTVQLAPPRLLKTAPRAGRPHRAKSLIPGVGVDGTGVKVCVLSDGVDSLAASQAAGELPAVAVLPGQAGSGDEGTALLEAIHDLAPGAALGFATASGGLASFAQNILDLHQDGCDVLVDNILYLSESPFQEGAVTGAVETVLAAGAVYVSSAGSGGNFNDGTAGTWEGDFHPSGTVPALSGGGAAHGFGGGGPSQGVTGFALAAVLQWTDPAGASANDYDLYVMDATLTTVLDVSDDVQDGDGDPIEITGPVFAGDRLVVLRASGEDRMLHLQAVGSAVGHQTPGCLRGHAAAAGALTVASVSPASITPGSVGGPTVEVLPASCDGLRRIFFDGGGTLLPGAPAGNFSASGGVVRNKPEITAGYDISLSPPEIPAVAQVAAIAALVRQAFPALTAAQVKQALLEAAIDIEEPGYDRDSGYGLVMALTTLKHLQGATAPPIPTLSEVGLALFGSLLGGYGLTTLRRRSSRG